MRKEIIMSEQEFNNLKNLVTIAKNTLEDDGKNDTLNGDGWYVLGLLNTVCDLLTWEMEE